MNSSSFTSRFLSICLFLCCYFRMKGCGGRKGKEKKTRPASISPDSFSHPASFRSWKGSTKPAKCIVDENHKGGFNWAVSRLVAAMLCPLLFGAVSHTAFSCCTVVSCGENGSNNYPNSASKLEQCPRQIQSRARMAARLMMFGNSRSPTRCPPGAEPRAI